MTRRSRNGVCAWRSVWRVVHADSERRPLLLEPVPPEGVPAADAEPRPGFGEAEFAGERGRPSPPDG
jgi:hypothetical protein